MNTYKITLVDFDNSIYTLYAKGRVGLANCLHNLGETKWKATSIKTVKNSIDILV